ncbi:hypothetical protein Pr1d_36810 [Bythopirellula goksoeyrii]|uniref:Uncharacterized protein n=1 Tax=Bythopirellula goksoeyrii TaxID=1400387 RepID=A0A5B9QBE7_9BACT|nr:hypothetical protein Pr1d_36810 [Bythopirellula goksoeyrii]
MNKSHYTNIGLLVNIFQGDSQGNSQFLPIRLQFHSIGTTPGLDHV